MVQLFGLADGSSGDLVVVGLDGARVGAGVVGGLLDPVGGKRITMNIQ